MLPLQFGFLTVSPVIDMRLRCRSEGIEYPTGVPRHISKVLELDIVSLKWTILADEQFINNHFACKVSLLCS